MPSETQSIMDIIDGPNRVRYEIIGTKVVTAAGAIAELLRVAEGEPLLVISRLTVVDGSPTCLWDTFIPEKKGLPLIASSSSLDFFEMLHEAFGIATMVIAMRVEAVLADASVTDLLQIEIGQPLLRYERVASDDAGNVIALSFGRARGDRVAMVVSGRRAVAAPDSSPKSQCPESQCPESQCPESQCPESRDSDSLVVDPETTDAQDAYTESLGPDFSGPVTVSPVITNRFFSDPVSATELEVQLS
jgi:hypothetical protein